MELTPENAKKFLELMEKRTSVNSETGCWEWEGSRDEGGYGFIRIDHILYRVHRISAVIFLGYRFDFTSLQLHVLHKCNNPCCWNYEHLYIGTPTENAQDRVNGGKVRTENFRNQNMDKTHCVRGHEFTPENTYEFLSKRDGTWQRNCKTCKIEQQRKRRLKIVS